jgi:hypothetical protein
MALGTTSRQLVQEAAWLGTTVMTAEPSMPSVLAVIVTWPGARALTSPVAETVATASALDAHAMVLPGTGAPAADLGVAASCAV